MIPRLDVIGITGIPDIVKGARLGKIIADAASRQGTPLEANDVLVVTQKIVSKAEGRVVSLAEIDPSPLALQFARDNERDPRHIEIMLREAKRIVRMDKGNIITETKHGFVCAASGVDASNIPGEDLVCLLPEDPDASARRILDEIQRLLPIPVAVIISDTFGRPWREGAINVAIGVAGIAPLEDYRGKPDAYGRILKVSMIAVVDELASASELVMAKSISVPVAIIRGYSYTHSDEGLKPLIMDSSKDMFR
ncbi:MAG: coenzyme F420-0:L-glutamate ligase [Chloroflexi bacterium]|nr:coenzyme F420-0:L-glutamate ligase [Chloroflexota bacterium]